MNVTFRTNATGSWGDINTNSSVNNGTYSQTNSSMNSFNTIYWWSVNVTDGYGWTNATYPFTTTNNAYVNSTYDSNTANWELTRFQNLTRAIDNVTAVSENVTIKVDPGTYEENLTIDIPLTITANSSEKPVIDGQGVIGINITANYTTISYLNITNCTKGIEINTTTGVNLTDITIERNEFYNCTTAIFSNATFENTTVTAHYNKFLNDNENISMGMNFTNAPYEFNGTLNYWGSITGANHSSNSNSTGVNVTDNVIFSPWIGINGGRISLSQLNITSTNGPNEFNATTSAGVAKINISTSGETTVAVAGYSSDSLPENIPNTVRTVGGILDIEIEDESVVNWPINLTMYYTASDLSSAGLDEENLDGMYRWNDTSESWEIYDNTDVNTTNVTVDETEYEGSCWANISQGQLSPKAMANTNDAPNTPTGINPEDAETYVDAQPTINVTVSDNDANNMTVEFYENSTGSWILQQTNTSVTNESNVVWNSYTTATENMTTYYWSVNITDGKLWTNNSYHFTTEIIASAPTGFTATEGGTSAIDLSWTKNSSANTTYIERSTSSSWSKGSGTEVYNDTGTSKTDSSLSSGTTYYYQAWSYNASNNSYSVTPATSSATTDSSSGTSPSPSPSPSPTPAPSATDDSPSISDVSHSPKPVTSEDTVTVSATVTDDNTVSIVMIYWNDGSEHSKSMSGSDDSYSANIGPFEGLSTVTYWIEATDNASQTTESDDHSFTVEDATGPVITQSYYP